MAQPEAQSAVEKWWRKCQKYSINANDALVTLICKAFETTNVFLSPTTDKARMDLVITSLDNDRKLILQFEKNGSDVLRHLSFGLIETIQVLLQEKRKNIEEQNQTPVEETVSAAEFVEMKHKLLESDGKLKRAVAKAGEYKARVEFLEKIIHTKEDILDNANSAESLDELRNKVAELTKQLEEEREGRMRDQDRFKQDQSIVMREPPPSETGTQLAIVDGYMGEPLFKKEELDFDFEVNSAILPIEQPLNELPSNDEDPRIVPSDVMGEDVNAMADPIFDHRNSTPIGMNTYENLSSIGEILDESDQAEMMEEANELMEEEEENDKRVDHTTINQKDSSETGEEKKKKKNSRPTITSSRPVNYADSIDDSEPLEKKPKINSAKKMDDKGRSDVHESSSKPPSKVVRVAKINHTDLKCPNCEYCSRSVHGWYRHLTKIHSSKPRDLGLALLCECGYESFSSRHSSECEMSKITVVRKNSTPQCVMCEAHPTTAYGYAQHLTIHHKTSLLQKGIFLMCSCGYTVRYNSGDPEHTKKCNGHDYTLHILDEEA